MVISIRNKELLLATNCFLTTNYDEQIFPLAGSREFELLKIYLDFKIRILRAFYSKKATNILFRVKKLK